ncbi:hypothetical protein U9M48_012954 [Paspalum notatum var. saurae]|uniref:CCHC-type domain-containing protein n=1 Tax=Paspalum notatum var. saurae TaxID=547442 RepID=A0AAQ3WJ49_PASNO
MGCCHHKEQDLPLCSLIYAPMCTMEDVPTAAPAIHNVNDTMEDAPINTDMSRSPCCPPSSPIDVVPIVAVESFMAAPNSQCVTLLKKLEDNPETALVQALDTRMTCEVCGNTGHSGSSCPETRPVDANFIGNSSNFNNGNRPQPGWNSHPYMPFSGQGNSSGNSQQFNKPSSFDPKGRLPGQPEPPPKEHLNAVTTRGGKSTQDPPHPSGVSRTNHTGKEQEKTTEMEENDDPEPSTGTAKEKAPLKTLPHEFYDTTVLPFPQRNKKAAADEQYSKFVEVIKKLYVNIPLLDAMQVPTYAKYLKDILNNKKPMPSAEIVHMTEECSAAILNQPPQKKKDPGSPTIPCSIRNQVFNQALCDLGASVSVMPKIVFDKLNHAALVPTSMCLQLADQSI